MKLPNSKNAFIPKEKLKGYLLSETHPVGKFKAKYFRNLGFDESNIDKLEKFLLSMAHLNEVADTKETEYGINYTINGQVDLPKHSKATIKTIWFIGTGQTRPQFVTAIPGIIQKGKRK
jgi:hypothetical protein